MIPSSLSIDPNKPMESSQQQQTPLALKPELARAASPSFRLRSPSLNTLRLRRVFDLFDSNGDGEITVDEFCGALDRLGLGADPSDLAAIVAAHTLPGRGGLAFEDFQGLHRALGDALFGEMDAAEEVDPTEADMVEAFKVFDEDHDGFISARELQAVLGKLGLREGESIDRVQQMICSVDRNCDGRIDFKEFKNMMMQGIAVEGS